LSLFSSERFDTSIVVLEEALVSPQHAQVYKTHDAPIPPPNSVAPHPPDRAGAESNEHLGAGQTDGVSRQLSPVGSDGRRHGLDEDAREERAETGDAGGHVGDVAQARIKIGRGELGRVEDERGDGGVESCEASGEEGKKEGEERVVESGDGVEEIWGGGEAEGEEAGHEEGGSGDEGDEVLFLVEPGLVGLVVGDEGDEDGHDHEGTAHEATDAVLSESEGLCSEEEREGLGNGPEGAVGQECNDEEEESRRGGESARSLQKHVSLQVALVGDGWYGLEVVEDILLGDLEGSLGDERPAELAHGGAGSLKRNTPDMVESGLGSAEDEKRHGDGEE